MADYISSVIAAAILSGTASLLSPDSWRKYVGVITGLVIMCTVIKPLSEVRIGDIFLTVTNSAQEEYNEEEGLEMRADMISSEMKRRCEEDIDKRLKDEFGISAKSDVKLKTDANGEIIGIDSISVSGKGIGDSALKLLREVYGVENISVK